MLAWMEFGLMDDGVGMDYWTAAFFLDCVIFTTYCFVGSWFDVAWMDL